MAVAMELRQQVKQQLQEAERVLARAHEAYMQALMATVRLQIQADMLFLSTGDKSLVDRP
jgi:hypothetical protein